MQDLEIKNLIKNYEEDEPISNYEKFGNLAIKAAMFDLEENQ